MGRVPGNMKRPNLTRRDFLNLTALSVGAMASRPSGLAEQSGRSISLITLPGDPIVSAEPATWAIQELGRTCAERGFAVRHLKSLERLAPSDVYVVASGRNTPLASEALKGASQSIPNAPESLALAPFHHQGKSMLLASGSDARGLMYALLELADRVRHAEDPMQALKISKAIVEEPFTAVRSIGRLLVSDVEDKPWFHDREMWPVYFSMLAGQRFNRFHLSFGVGYDFLQNVTDAYFLFAYPFLLSVPGYKVQAVNLPDEERDRNLQMLQFISQQAVAHGIDFQLGIWTHGYEWQDSPHANYLIQGLTHENHASYSRDALAALLQACPAISGVTLRTHGESGVREGSYAFWKTVFAGVAQAGREVEIDLHTKGLDQTLIDAALATGMPVKLSPKYWAEHMGLPYHQAAIRELEMPHEAANSQGFFSLSSGSRSFTRYGYADFLREDRAYSVMHRIWPGTHRFLLWGDPLSTAAHARAFRFCGSNGVELFEPLSFKGRRGSGIPGGRCAYADASLTPHWDWEKYLYTYRVWGRLLYNPDTEADTWRRYLRRRFQSKAAALEGALASATRILPLVTTAHLPSAANEAYHPELYANQPIAGTSLSHPYSDTPSPKVFANVSPLDPQLFSRISDFAGELLEGERSGKYSPVEVAQWLEDLSETAARHLAEAEGRAETKRDPEFRRVVIDLKIEIGLGRFFAAKLRSGTLYSLYEHSGDRVAIEEALKSYRGAREIWSTVAEDAKGIYASDITVGPEPNRRGHWLSRLPAIDSDIAEMAKRLESLQSSPPQTENLRRAIAEALGRPARSAIICGHTPPERFVPGEPLELLLSVEKSTEPTLARLYYRHVNQAERYELAEIHSQDRELRVAIPRSYTTPTYPVQYYFELRQGTGRPWLYPGLAADLSNQPYFVVRPARGIA